jgi:hypothetical protein
LQWLHSVFCGAEIMTRRRLRQRGGLLSLDWLARWVARLVLVRAAEFVGPRRPLRRLIRERGVDLKPRHFMRSVIGSKLRRMLKHRDAVKRITLLIGALSALDTLAALFAKRLRRRITKLWAIAARSFCAAPHAAGAAFAPSADDTS